MHSTCASTTFSHLQLEYPEQASTSDRPSPLPLAGHLSRLHSLDHQTGEALFEEDSNEDRACLTNLLDDSTPKFAVQESTTSAFQDYVFQVKEPVTPSAGCDDQTTTSWPSQRRPGQQVILYCSNACCASEQQQVNITLAEGEVPNLKETIASDPLTTSHLHESKSCQNMAQDHQNPSSSSSASVYENLSRTSRGSFKSSKNRSLKSRLSVNPNGVSCCQKRKQTIAKKQAAKPSVGNLLQVPEVAVSVSSSERRRQKEYKQQWRHNSYVQLNKQGPYKDLKCAKSKNTVLKSGPERFDWAQCPEKEFTDEIYSNCDDERYVLDRQNASDTLEVQYGAYSDSEGSDTISQFKAQILGTKQDLTLLNVADDVSMKTATDVKAPQIFVEDLIEEPLKPTTLLPAVSVEAEADEAERKLYVNKIVTLVSDSIQKVIQLSELNVDVPKKDQYLLPPQHHFKPTLVLDLDETLVHCSLADFKYCQTSFDLRSNSGPDPSGMINSTLPQQVAGTKVFCSFRPYLLEFLETCKESFELVLFTASEKEYADHVLSFFDPDDKYFDHRLYREACTFVEGVYIKDLSCLGRPIESTIIVDNSVVAFACHLTNGVPIPSFFGQPWDVELKLLAEILADVGQASVPDVRPLLDTMFNLTDKIWPQQANTSAEPLPLCNQQSTDPETQQPQHL